MFYRFLCCIVLDWLLIYFICSYGIVFNPRFILSISIDVWYLIYRISKSLIRCIDTYNILFDPCMWWNNCAPFLMIIDDNSIFSLWFVDSYDILFNF